MGRAAGIVWIVNAKLNVIAYQLCRNIRHVSNKITEIFLLGSFQFLLKRRFQMGKTDLISVFTADSLVSRMPERESR